MIIMKLLFNPLWVLMITAVLITTPNQALLNDVLSVADPLLDTLLSRFKNYLSSLTYEKIGSDFISDADDLLRYNFGLTNEDRHLNGFQLLTKYGFTYEVYTVKTIDGYLLKVVRIPGKGAVVLLVHGLLLSWECFLTSGPDFGLAYLLARAGFDVWLLNTRGNTFSRKHITLSPEQEEFLDFTWHEIGTRDLPAIADKILSVTGKKQLIYIGHSQGTTASFVWLSECPEYNSVVKLMISLSPVGYFNHAKSPIFRALTPFRNEEYIFLNTLGHGEFAPSDGFGKIAKDLICSTTLTANLICSQFMFLTFGFDYAQMNLTNFPVILAHQPAGASVKQLLHYLQEVASGYFRKFDYGKEGNLKIYKSVEPPNYNISNIVAPVAFYYAKNDYLADPIDVERLAQRIPRLVEKYLVPYEKFNHIDYLWAKDVIPLLYKRVFKVLKKYT